MQWRLGVVSLGVLVAAHSCADTASDTRRDVPSSAEAGTFHADAGSNGHITYRDAASLEAGEAAAPVPGVDAAWDAPVIVEPALDAAPPDCGAPCVQRLLDRCRPEDPCTTDGTLSPAQSSESWSISCTANDWWQVSRSYRVTGGTGVDVFVGGSRCYSASRVRWGFSSWTMLEWSDGDGAVVAKGVALDDGRSWIQCPDGGPDEPRGNADCSDQLLAPTPCYIVDPSQPHCPAPNDPVCTPGTCSGPRPFDGGIFW